MAKIDWGRILAGAATGFAVGNVPGAIFGGLLGGAPQTKAGEAQGIGSGIGFLDRMTETKDQRDARHAASQANIDARRQAEESAAEEARQQNVANFVRGLGEEKYTYNPESESMDIARRRAQASSAQYGKNLGKALASRGVSSSGAIQKALARMQMAQQGQLDEASDQDMARQYSMFSNEQQRRLQSVLAANQIETQAYQNAMNEFYQQQALRQQALNQQLSTPNAFDKYVAPLIGPALQIGARAAGAPI